MKKYLSIFVIVLLLIMSGCSQASSDYNGYYDPGYYGSEEEYTIINEEGYLETEANNKINVSMDSSTAAYSNIRNALQSGRTVTKDMVNIEQMINYFNYSYKNECDDELKVFMEMNTCPWNVNNKLLQVAVKAKDFELDSDKSNNFVFLLDVSGSMDSEDKLPLVQNAFKLLVDNLQDNDRISIVTYAGYEKVVLSGGFGYEKIRINALINDLSASGSTNGSGGLEKAYELAREYYIEDGNNRVFLATDGDFNVGLSSLKSLEKYISDKRETGIYLSVLGFGTGNIKSNKMETLANNGNGNYYYIDSILEAKKVFVEELGGTLNTLAKDCKTQIEFNRDIVKEYRIIGYETKLLSDEEFENSETDAGEIGASHVTICLVEVVLSEEYSNEGQIAKCTVKYKNPDSNIEKVLIEELTDISEIASSDFILASSIAEFGLLLRNSEYKGTASYENILSRIDNEDFKKDVYREELIELINLCK